MHHALLCLLALVALAACGARPAEPVVQVVQQTVEIQVTRVVEREVTRVVEREVVITATPEPVTPTVEVTAAPTEAPTVAPIVEPTAAPAPTEAPTTAPPVAERRLAPPCTELMRNKEAMTDVQWKAHKEDVRGTWLIENPATVREVGAKSWLAGGYPIYVDFTGDCDFYYVAKTEEEALRFAKGQRVIITTQIEFIDERLFGGMTYYAEDFTTEIR